MAHERTPTIILRIDTAFDFPYIFSPQYLAEHYPNYSTKRFTQQVEDAVKVTKIEADTIMTRYNSHCAGIEHVWIMSVHK